MQRGVVFVKIEASEKQRLTHGERQLRPGHHASRQAGHLLGEISDESHKDGKPMLSAIVVNQTGRPGKGFYELAIRLGKLAPGASSEDRENFWKREVNAVFATTW